MQIVVSVISGRRECRHCHRAFRWRLTAVVRSYGSRLDTSRFPESRAVQSKREGEHKIHTQEEELCFTSRALLVYSSFVASLREPSDPSPSPGT